MSEHLHAERVPGCFRCELGADEGDACACGHFHEPGTECGRWWFYPDVLTSRQCGCTEWRKPA